MLRQLFPILPALLVLAASSQAQAGGYCGSHCYSAPYCQPVHCQPQYACHYVEKTIRVPKVVMEEREVTVVRYRKEIREKRVTVQRCVAVPHQVEREYTVMVPYKVKKEGVRQVCKYVPVQKKYHVYEDHGHYKKVCYKAPACGHGCGYGCGHCYTHVYCCKKWVPHVVKVERSCTVLKPTYHDVPYTYHVVKHRPEKRVSRHTVMKYKYVPEERTVKYCVMVPERVKKTVHIPVCHYVPKKIRVMVCRPVCHGGGCYH